MTRSQPSRNSTRRSSRLSEFLCRTNAQAAARPITLLRITSSRSQNEITKACAKSRDLARHPKWRPDLPSSAASITSMRCVAALSMIERSSAPKTPESAFVQETSLVQPGRRSQHEQLSSANSRAASPFEYDLQIWLSIEAASSVKIVAWAHRPQLERRDRCYPYRLEAVLRTSTRTQDRRNQPRSGG